MRKAFLLTTLALSVVSGVVASCTGSVDLGLDPARPPNVDAGPTADAEAPDAAPDVTQAPPTARVLQVAAWPGRGFQVVVELSAPAVGAGLPSVSLEGPSGEVIAADIDIVAAQPGVTALLVVPAEDPSVHAARLAAAAAVIDALPPDESVIVLAAGAAPVLMADRSTDRVHAQKRLLEIAPAAGYTAAAVLTPARALLADCGKGAVPLPRSLVVVGESAEDDGALAVDPIQTLAITGLDPAAPAAAALVVRLAERRAALVRVGACAGLAVDAPFLLHVGDAIAKLTAPEPLDHMLDVTCDAGEAARDVYPYPSEIQLSFTAAERAIFDGIYQASSEDPFQTSVTLGVGAPIVTTAHLHGQGSLACERKSFSVHLDGPRRRLGSSFADDHFFLLSMCLDDRYFGQVFGERLMARLGVFPPNIHYVRVRVDGENRGVYLMVQRPEDVVRTDDAGILSVIRRRYDFQGIPADVKYPDDPAAMAAALASYDELATIAQTAPPSDIAPQLDARFDVDGYLRLLAVESALSNGDYIDEAFFYASSEAAGPYHRSMGWDLDDLFEPCHGGGLNAIVDACGLTYCAEALIDQALVRSPEVYQRYKTALGAALNVLTPELLKSTMDSVRDELWQVLADDETSAALTEMVSEVPGAVSVAVGRQDIQLHMNAMLASALARRMQLVNSLAACPP